RITVTPAPLIPTAVTAEPAHLKVGPGIKLSLGPLHARLTGANGQPLRGRTLRFTSGGQLICTAVTNGDGRANCSGAISDVITTVLNAGYDVTFAGDEDLGGSSGHGGLVRIGPLKL
ncbi:MAG: hypothetical protein QOE93_942, partial [Actinomycetota bacterium]|nr:hypothetical protein [Actinomycetota bacterium]